MILPNIYRLQRYYSDREIVPRDIAQRARKEGVVQQDKDGDWRIISFKQNPPEFWDAHYDSKEDAEKALGAYHAQKHYSSYDNVSDEDLENEVYKRAVKKYKRRTRFWKTLGGSILGAGAGYLMTKFLPSNNKPWIYRNGRYGRIRLNLFKNVTNPTTGGLIGGVIGGIGGVMSGNGDDFMNSERFKRILRREYKKAYRNRPRLTRQDDYEDLDGSEQRYYSSYDNVSDEDLENEVYKRAIQKHRRRALLKGTLLGGLTGAFTGWLKHKFGFGNPAHAAGSSLIGAGLGALGGAFGGYTWGKYYQGEGDEMNSPEFQKILKREYEKAYKKRPQPQITSYQPQPQRPQQNYYEEDEDNDY